MLIDNERGRGRWMMRGWEFWGGCSGEKGYIDDPNNGDTWRENHPLSNRVSLSNSIWPF